MSRKGDQVVEAPDVEGVKSLLQGLGGSATGRPVSDKDPGPQARGAPRSLLQPPPLPPPVLTVTHRFRVNSCAFSKLFDYWIDAMQTDCSRVISIVEVIENEEAWLLVQETREVPEYYGSAYYARRDAMARA